MLTVYATSWCPHSRKMIRFLTSNHIDFIYRDIEHQPQDVVQPVIDANGGQGWIVPTLEYKGKWRPGKVFNESEVRQDLDKWGLIH